MAWTSRVLLAFALLLASASLGCSTRRVEATEVPPPATDDTTLGPGDAFTVRVYAEEELSGSHRIGPDGTIDFPLLGPVDVNGLEPPDVAKRIQRLLKEGDFLRNPHVSVYVDEYASKRISVIGAVANPGTFPVEPGMTVVQAISMAGGFSSLADRDATMVNRRANGQTVRYRVPAGKVTKGQAEDVEVAPGDIIFVPERLF